MRTKTLLLAVAALAAGIVSSEAQSNVYSQNIVGYVNVIIQGGGSNTLVAVPLDDGNGNQATNLFSALPNNSIISLWDATHQNFDISISKTAGAWNGGLTINPGTAAFIKNGGPAAKTFTNTFVGSFGPGSVVTFSNSAPLVVGYNMLGSAIPYSSTDVTTDTNINLGGLPNNSILETWNVPSQSFANVSSKTAGSWNAPIPLNVGQGMFIYVKKATNWSEVFISQ